MFPASSGQLHSLDHGLFLPSSKQQQWITSLSCFELHLPLQSHLPDPLRSPSSTCKNLHEPGQSRITFPNSSSLTLITSVMSLVKRNLRCGHLGWWWYSAYHLPPPIFQTKKNPNSPPQTGFKFPPPGPDIQCTSSVHLKEILI